MQCDEAHPTCNNCKKSKRDCLGYDPIFKQQGPTAIQPAPNTQPPSVPPTTLASTPNVPYQPQPPVVPSSYPAPAPLPSNVYPAATAASVASVASSASATSASVPLVPSVSSTTTPQSAKTEPGAGFDYTSAVIDPALQATDAPANGVNPSPLPYQPQHQLPRHEDTFNKAAGARSQPPGGTPSLHCTSAAGLPGRPR